MIRRNEKKSISIYSYYLFQLQHHLLFSMETIIRYIMHIVIYLTTHTLFILYVSLPCRRKAQQLNLE